jgi:electron transfer flavoprotein beta subunit
VENSSPRPPRDKGVKIEDSGDGGNKLVEFLLEKRVV